MSILALDIGTTKVKGAVFSDSGALLISESEEAPRIESDSGNEHEIHPLGWKTASFALIERLSRKIQNIDRIVVSGNGPTLFPISKDSLVLHSALLWMDRRATKEALLISEALGYNLDASFFLPKALWFKNSLPEIYENTYAFLSPPEYISFLLTGTKASFIPNADYERYYWNDSIFSILESPHQKADLSIDKKKFPCAARPGTDLGLVIEEVRCSLALAPQCRVVAGVPDFLSALLGGGAVTPGIALDRSGTSEALNLCTTKKPITQKLFCLPHIAKDLFNVSAGVSASARSLEWFSKIAGVESLEKALELASTSPEGSRNVLFLPHLAGERAPLWDPFARGAFIGLALHHRKEDLFRAITEAVAFSLRLALDTMADSGFSVSNIRATGGPNKSPFWLQVKADILDRELEIPLISDAELMGNACIALYSKNEYKSLEEASHNLVKISHIVRPSKSNTASYKKNYELYLQSYESLKDISHALAKDGGRV